MTQVFDGSNWSSARTLVKTAGGWGGVGMVGGSANAAVASNAAAEGLIMSSTKVPFAKEVAADLETALNTANGDAGIKAWWMEHYDRYRAYQPYTGYSGSTYQWFREKAWAYKDMLAIYVTGDTGMVGGGSIVTENPTWRLRDGSNNLLYINYGSPGDYGQYAGDPGNSDFRENWIARFAEQHSAVKGIAVDDVNHSLSGIVNWGGDVTVPINPRTELGYTQSDWEDDIATFLDEIVAAFPTLEIVPNVVWFNEGGEANSAVQQMIQASDVMHVERGFNDENLDVASIAALFSYVDYCHSQGTGCWFDVQTNSNPDWALASYYLAMEPGLDYVGTSMQYMDSTYGDWWTGPIGDGWDTDIGAPSTQRFRLGDSYLRDFDDGYTVTANSDTLVSTIAATVPTVGVDFAAASSETFRYGVGTVVGSDSFTVAALVNRNTSSAAYEAVFNFSNSGSGGLGGLGFHDDNSVRIDANGGGSWQTTVKVLDSDGWAIIVGSYNTSGGGIRLSRKLLSGGTWAHDDGWTTRTDIGASDRLYIGSWNGVSNFFNGAVAVLAVWDSVLSDGNRETLDDNLNTSDWLTLSPKALWDGNLFLDVADNGADYTDATGTLRTASGPSGWTFS